MSDPNNIIKFGKARKALRRRKKDDKSAQNRALFGRTKAEKLRGRQSTDKLRHAVDMHKRETD